MHERYNYYYKAVQTFNRMYAWKVYRYDATGNHEFIVAQNHKDAFFRTAEAALDSAADWCEANGFDDATPDFDGT